MRNVKEDLEKIHTYVKRKYACCNGIDVEDLLSEANYQFATILSNYEGDNEDNFVRYSIYKINLRLIDYLRVHGPADRNGKKRITPTMLSSFPDGGENILNSLYTLNTFDSINQDDVEALSKSLDKEEKSIIEGIYYQNKTINQISKEQDVSYYVIKEMHKKALEKMRGIDEDIQ